MLCRLNFDYDHVLKLIKDRRPRVEFDRYRCHDSPSRGRDALAVLRAASQLWLAAVRQHQQGIAESRQGVPPQAPAAASTDGQGVPPQEPDTPVNPPYNPWDNYFNPKTKNKVAAIV